MWFWLSLLSAVLGAADIIISKYTLKKVSPVVLNWAANSLMIPFILVIVLRSGIPAFNLTFWIAVTGSSLAWVVGKSMFNVGLKNHLTSQIIPLTSFSGIFTYVLALLFLNEHLRLLSVAGLFLVVIGSYILNADQAKEDLLKPFKLILKNKNSVLFLLALVITSFTAILDKTGLLNISPVSVLFVLLIEDILETIMLTSYLMVKEKTWIKEVKENYKLLFVNSLMLFLIGYVIFLAYTIQGPVALVLGIKRLQIFFILMFGYLFLNDKPTKHTWIATAVMIVGTILIKVG